VSNATVAVSKKATAIIAMNAMTNENQYGRTYLINRVNSSI